MITLEVNGRELYRDTYGREKALDFLISEIDNEFVDITHESSIKKYFLYYFS